MKEKEWIELEERWMKTFFELASIIDELNAILATNIIKISSIFPGKKDK